MRRERRPDAKGGAPKKPLTGSKGGARNTAARWARQLASVEIFVGCGLIGRLGHVPGLSQTVAAMIDCMRGDHPPMCGGCDNRLRTPPALWALIEAGKTTVLCASCRACAGRGPD